MKPTPQTTVREFVENFYCIERPIGEKQVYQLRDMVRVLKNFVGYELVLGELNENLASRWTAWLEDEGYARETCAGKQRILLAVWRYASDFGVVDEPRKRRIRKVRKPAPLICCWTLEEIERLIAAVDTAMSFETWHAQNPRWTINWWRTEMIGKHYHGIDPILYWRAFIRTAFDSGLRLSDVLSIHRGDIDDDGVLVVRQQKTGQPIVCTLSPETLDAIDVTFPPDRELVFPWAGKWRQKFHVRFRALVKAAGIRKGTTKFLRRSRATYAERDQPGLARRVLGHASSDTWKRYFDPRIGQAPPPAAPKLNPERFAPQKRIEGPRLLIEGPKREPEGGAA